MSRGTLVRRPNFGRDRDSDEGPPVYLEADLAGWRRRGSAIAR
jgi:hypothetical protein